MTSKTDLKQIATGALRVIEQGLDLADELAAFRDAATEKGIDWSQLKALLKAQAQDARDNTDKRVTRLLEKAGFATAYADMLGIGSDNVNENGKIHSSSAPSPLPDSPPAAPPRLVTTDKPPGGAADPTEFEGIPEFLDRRKELARTDA